MSENSEEEFFGLQWADVPLPDGLYLPEDRDKRTPHPDTKPEEIFEATAGTYNKWTPAMGQNNLSFSFANCLQSYHSRSGDTANPNNALLNRKAVQHLAIDASINFFMKDDDNPRQKEFMGLWHLRSLTEITDAGNFDIIFSNAPKQLGELHAWSISPGGLPTPWFLREDEDYKILDMKYNCPDKYVELALLLRRKTAWNLILPEDIYKRKVDCSCPLGHGVRWIWPDGLPNIESKDIKAAMDRVECLWAFEKDGQLGT
ncbi:uncharacterized protein PAC_07154 [Phialocephala subalpina]|uniref:Uncharacterized protein n=1 Tax=Phialocephala subalpina TaxID=576137 RepID=A0A1L7WWW2_9HELO|nr:uncharacterized protein PAC_07154 [Phialocephala subalpina]